MYVLYEYAHTDIHHVGHIRTHTADRSVRQINMHTIRMPCRAEAAHVPA